MQTNTDMKVINSKQISPFGGLNFIIKALDNRSIGSTLNNELPDLPKQSQFDWRDIIYNFWSIYFCGGDCIEDLSENLKHTLKDNPLLRSCSPDSLLKRMKELSVPSQEFGTPRGNSVHQFSINDKLNELNLKLLNKVDRIKVREHPVVLDYDNTLIFTEKSDAKMTYKKAFGYAPGVGIIEDKVVYIENRNGNSDAQTLQQDTLARMFSLLKKQGVKVDVFRADSASYQLSTLLEVVENVDKFYIKARMNAQLYSTIDTIENWEKIEIAGEEAYRASIEFSPFKQAASRLKYQKPLKNYRYVVTKIKRNDGQLNLFTGEDYTYSAIITNDKNLSNDQVVFFYNQRGKIEREFDALKNDFGWGNLPFSNLEHNTVFLLFSAICKNLYTHIIKEFSKKVKGLKAHFRIKKFIFRFICTPAKWVKNARCWKLRIYGNLAFKT